MRCILTVKTLALVKLYQIWFKKNGNKILFNHFFLHYETGFITFQRTPSCDPFQTR